MRMRSKSFLDEKGVKLCYKFWEKSVSREPRPRAIASREGNQIKSFKEYKDKYNMSSLCKYCFSYSHDETKTHKCIYCEKKIICKLRYEKHVVRCKILYDKIRVNWKSNYTDMIEKLENKYC